MRYLKLMKEYRKLRARVEDIYELARVRGLFRGEMTNFEMYDSFVSVTSKLDTCSCCSPEIDSHDIPVKWLFMPIDLVLGEIADRLTAERLEAERLVEEKKAQAVENERQEYERLRAKFEG